MTTLPVALAALALASLTLAASPTWAAIGAIHMPITAVAQDPRPASTEVGTPRPDDPRLPRLSIVVAARNEEGSVERALRSLLALRYDDYEVVFVNDRSDDRTGEIAERLSAGDGGSGCFMWRSFPRGGSGRTMRPSGEPKRPGGMSCCSPTATSPSRRVPRRMAYDISSANDSIT